MLAHNEYGLDVGDLCVVGKKTGSSAPVAYPLSTNIPTHKVIRLEVVTYGAKESIVTLEELPKEEVSIDERIANLLWILIGCVVVLIIQALLAPPPIP